MALIWPDGSIHYVRRSMATFKESITVDPLCRWASIDLHRLRHIDSPRRVCRACLAEAQRHKAGLRQLPLPFPALSAGAS